jgi:TIR domain/SIR2-like domain
VGRLQRLALARAALMTRSVTEDRMQETTATDIDLWDTLLLGVEEGQVVPLVGRDLLVVDTPAGPRLFHHLVAEQLAAELKVSRDRLPLEFDVNDVVCAYEHFHGDPMTINPKVVRILRGLKVSPPEPLRLLAEIPSLRLFVSASCDTLLEEALTKVRGRPPAVVAFPAVSNLVDFDDVLLEQSGSVVFQILGRASASTPFAVTEGQVLEHMHDLMAGARRPERLIARLRESHLLILGVSFPDWLARFLLRLARAKPLWDSRALMEIIADVGRSHQDFAVFLRHFSPQQSRLYAGGSPVDFVRELHRRWFERHPQGAGAGTIAAQPVERPAEMAGGCVFISYASEDREAAFHLADALAGFGIEVWVDRRLNPGDDYRYIIERHIRECSAFIPVISRHTQASDERWFRREWAQACDRAQKYFGSDRGFLFPVVVDETPLAELNETRRETFRRSAVRATRGAPPAELLGELDRAQKAWRRQFARV